MREREPAPCLRGLLSERLDATGREIHVAEVVVAGAITAVRVEKTKNAIPALARELIRQGHDPAMPIAFFRASEHRGGRVSEVRCLLPTPLSFWAARALFEGERGFGVGAYRPHPKLGGSSPTCRRRGPANPTAPLSRVSSRLRRLSNPPEIEHEHVSIGRNTRLGSRFQAHSGTAN